MKFRTLVQQERGLNATGLVVPDDVVAALGGGRRAAVVVTVNGYSYRSTIMVMGARRNCPSRKSIARRPELKAAKRSRWN